MLYVFKNIALRKPSWIGGRNVGKFYSACWNTILVKGAAKVQLRYKLDTLAVSNPLLYSN